MGLIELLQRGQTTLSAGSFPGDTPINDPQSGFIQSTSPTNTYSNETVGQLDNGSVLATTLDNTALDNTNTSHTTTTDIPALNTFFPLPAKGRYGLAPYVFNPNYNPSHTYLSLAGPNFTWHNNTELRQTSLDNTNGNRISATPIPNSISYPNYYPSIEDVNLGPFNGAPSTDPTYSTPYNPNNTYLDNISINDSNSPQIGTLDQTGLDNSDNDNEFTAIVPDSITYPNNYPTIDKVYLGEFRGAPSPYETVYNPDNTYLVDVPIQTPNSPQIPTLDQSSLDNANTGNISTTNPIPNANTFPNNYPILSPQTRMGKFGLQPNQYYTIWASNNKYYSQFNYDNIITNSSNALVTYLDYTGLTLDPSNLASFIQTYPFNQTYLGSPGFPSFVTGQFNGAPSIFPGIYDGGNIYLNNVPIKTPNSPQLNTLDNTGLDNTDTNANLTAFKPNSLTTPNNYPTIGDVNLGEWNGAPSQYQTIYNADATYLSYHPIQQESSPQYNTLNKTGLDNTSPENEFTTFTPNDTTSFPTIEGANLGEWNGAPSQYNFNQAYRPDNTYLSNINIGDPDSPQIHTLDQSGLDNTGSNIPTVIVPDSLTYPNNYPAIQNVSLGAFNGAPSQYESSYNSNSTYLDIYSTVINDDTNPLNNNLNSSGLDNTYPFEAAPTAEIPFDNTIYPVFSSGQWRGASQLFTQNYGPSTNQYYPPFVTTSNTDLLSQQYDSLSKTGLDVDNEESIPTTNTIPNPDTITVYPAENVTSNSTGGAPHRFKQLWRPAKRYYNDYIKSLKEQNLV